MFQDDPLHPNLRVVIRALSETRLDEMTRTGRNVEMKALIDEVIGPDESGRVANGAYEINLHAIVTDFQLRVTVLVNDTDSVDRPAGPAPAATISRDFYRRIVFFGTFRSPADVDGAIHACDAPGVAPVIGSRTGGCPSGYPDGCHKGTLRRFASTRAKTPAYGYDWENDSHTRRAVIRIRAPIFSSLSRNVEHWARARGVPSVPSRRSACIST